MWLLLDFHIFIIISHYNLAITLIASLTELLRLLGWTHNVCLWLVNHTHFQILCLRHNLLGYTWTEYSYCIHWLCSMCGEGCWVGGGRSMLVCWYACIDGHQLLYNCQMMLFDQNDPVVWLLILFHRNELVHAVFVEVNSLHWFACAIIDCISLQWPWSVIVEFTLSERWHKIRF